ncbi:MAG: MFS transporter [Bacilli bacterium]
MNSKSNSSPLKLNYKRTCLIGFAFFGILLLWQVYDSWCPTMLTELFKEVFHTTDERSVQYLVGIVMAFDNLAALIMLPIFGKLSDRTHTKIGKRMPFILVGTFVCAIAFPFIPVFFHFHNLFGTFVVMAIVVFFAMMYRNPAVALMPDMTPKPLRSKANGIINIMGYIGGAFATVLAIFFSFSKYLGTSENTSEYWVNGTSNIWLIEGPFLVASVLILVSALVLFFNVNENKIAEEVRGDMELGEKLAAVEDDVSKDEEKPMSKANKIMLILILAAEFLWFMSDNAVSTFIGNYTIFYLGCEHSSSMINTIVGGVGSVIGFLIGGILSSKIGRKWTVFSGLSLAILGTLIWILCSSFIPLSASSNGFNVFPAYLYIVWFIKGFGMSLVHVNSFPMVVELCSSKKIGKFTGLYYASSMAAQTITPCLLGVLLLPQFNFDFSFLPIYSIICLVLSLIVFFFVKNIKVDKNKIKKGLEALDVDN